MPRPTVSAILASASSLLMLAPSASAAPTDPVSVSAPPEGQGAAFVPGTRPLPANYVEEEFIVSGEATLFSYAHNPPFGPTDIVPIQTDVPYATRIIVRRPAEKGHFRGRVVVEWWNSTAGFDTAPVWDVSAEYFAREGIAYVGVTNSTTSLGFLVDGCRLLGFLPPSCGTRYSTLSLPENGLAYEMVSQIANLLRSDSADNPLPTGFDVDRLYHAGQSQQGGSIITYASAFHFDANDGYFVQQAGSARSINSGSACGVAGSFPFPFCTPRLSGADRLVRTDLPVPVVHAISETDIEVLGIGTAFQPDTPTFRYYEIAGGSHLTVHDAVEVIPAGVFGPNPILLEELCAFEINSTADGPVFVSYVFNALWENLDEQVRRGRKPPAGRTMDRVGPVQVVRDAFGNGVGGVRPPSLEVPVATYRPGNVADPNLPDLLQFIGNLACRLASSVTPFDDATMGELYPNHGSYVNQVNRSVNELMRDGFLLNKDASKIRVAASHSDIGCGLGFEIAFVLPLAMGLRRRNRRH